MGTTPTIVRGDNTPQLQQIVYDFDPQRGWNVITEYKGASQLYMEALAKQYAAAKIACRLTYQKDMAVLEAHDATQQYTLDVWQILGNEESVDLFSHPTVVIILTGYAQGPQMIADIRQGLANDQSFQDIQGTSKALPTLGAADAATMAVFYSLYQRGTTQFRKANYVLRHTTNCPNSWPANAPSTWPANIAMNNVECIYPLPLLLSEVINVNSWILPLPPEMQYTLQQIPAPTPISGYLFGWLKGVSTTSTAANNRVDISTEYILENWSTWEYEIATAQQRI